MGSDLRLLDHSFTKVCESLEGRVMFELMLCQSGTRINDETHKSRQPYMHYTP